MSDVRFEEWLNTLMKRDCIEEMCNFPYDIGSRF